MEPNKIRQRLASGKAVSVVSGLHNADMAEYLASLGVDGVWIEGEHGSVDWDEIGDYARACDIWGAASIVRISAGEPWIVTRTLDRGASGIVVPHVSTRADAQKVAQAARFAPLGLRGMFGGRRSWNAPDFYNRSNEETLVVVLIEEIEAVRNLAEILTVENIDVFFVAPSDLAQTMGLIGQLDHPELKRTIDGAIRQIVDAGRTAGALVSDQNRQHYLDLGVRFTMTSYLPWIAQGVAAYRKAMDAVGG